MSRKISRLLLSFLIASIPLTQVFAKSALDFELVPMHYGLIKGEPMTKGENKGVTEFTLARNVKKGEKQVKITEANKLHSSELIVYKSTLGNYHVAQIKKITGTTVELIKPLKEGINAGKTIWNFYDDSSHPNRRGFKAIVDFALAQLNTDKFPNKVHAFIGDSWFDNSTVVPRFTKKLNASKIINEGVGGRTSVDVLESFDAAFPINANNQPDYFWVILGTNDYWAEISREDYINNLKSIIKKVNDRGAKAIVFTPSVAPIIKDPNTGETVTFFHELSNDYADDLLALQSTGKDSITAFIKNDDLVVELTPTDSISDKANYLYFIDTDNDKKTGFISSNWDNGGSDYMIQNGHLHKSQSNGTSWEWKLKHKVALEEKNKIAIAKSDIGLASNAVIKVAVLVLSEAWDSVEGVYPNSGKMQEVTLSSSGAQFKVNDDTAKVESGSEVTIDVLANDTGTELTISDVDNPTNGSAHVSAKKLIYTANTDYSGIDSFWYEVTDSTGRKKRGIVKVTVTKVATGLEAKKDTVTVKSGNVLTIDALANDIGTKLKIAWFDNPAHGSIKLSNNKLIYTPDSGFIGTENFWYEAVDSSGSTDWGNIIITVTEGGGGNNNKPLLAKDDTASVKLGESVIIDVLDNDDGKSLKLVSVDNAWTGTISIEGNKVKYQSDGRYTGTIKFWYDVSDSKSIDWAKVSIKITN